METDYPGERVTFTRRFFGDGILEGLLFLFTLGIGWLIWFAIVAPGGQTPAKKLLNVRIHDATTGAVATTSQVWIRDFVGKFVLPFVLTLLFYAAFSTSWQEANSVSNAYNIISGVMILGTNRGIWDRLAGTVVRYNSPATVAGNSHEARTSG